MADINITAPVGSIQKFSVEDGPGIRTTVFLKGCPLKCAWCHNPEMIDFNPQLIRLTSRCIGCGYCKDACSKEAIYEKEGRMEIDWSKCDSCLACTKVCYADCLQSVAEEMSAEQIVKEAEKDKGFYDHTGGGITVSGGELLSRADFVSAIIQKAALKGINVCLDTCGYGNYEDLHALAAYANVTDILYDMKCILPQKHLEGTGVGNEMILANLIRLAADQNINSKITMRMPLMKGFNDSEDVIKATADFYDKNNLRRITLLPYHTLGVSKSERIGKVPDVFEPPSKDRITEIRAIFEGRGFCVEVLGE